MLLEEHSQVLRRWGNLFKVLKKKTHTKLVLLLFFLSNYNSEFSEKQLVMMTNVQSDLANTDDNSDGSYNSQSLCFSINRWKPHAVNLPEKLVTSLINTPFQFSKHTKSTVNLSSAGDTYWGVCGKPSPPTLFSGPDWASRIIHLQHHLPAKSSKCYFTVKSEKKNEEKDSKRSLEPHLDVAAAPQPWREGDEEEEEVCARRQRHADVRVLSDVACVQPARSTGRK